MGGANHGAAHGLRRAKVPCAIAVVGGEVLEHVHSCELGQTPLNAKRPIDCVTAAALYPELVRCAEAELAMGDDGGHIVPDVLDCPDPTLDSAEVDELPRAEGDEA